MFKKAIAWMYKNVFFRKSMRLYRKNKLRDIYDFSSNLPYQIEKVNKVLDLALKNIPFYNSCYINYPLDITSYEEFQKLPLIDKDIIRNQIDDLKNLNYDRIDEVFKNSSGGSTGEPVIFFRTKEQSCFGNASYFHALHLNQVDINDASLDLWGAERDMYTVKRKYFDLRSIVHNKHTLNTFVLSDEIIRIYIHQMNVYKPKFVKAYVHSIYEISKYINQHNIKILFTPIIHCTTGPLYPEMREEIKRAFNHAHVYNFYGSREVSAIASETRNVNGLYVMFDNVFVEILDAQNKPVKKGEEGEIVITTLNNFYMPLIRYKIGDRAIKGDDLEFGTLKLESVLGRTLGVIHRSDGSRIDGQFFTTLFFGLKGIKNFQIVQKTLHLIVLNIVRSEFFTNEELEIVVNRIKVELPGAFVTVCFCDIINLTSTGKIMYVYSELDYRS